MHHAAAEANYFSGMGEAGGWARQARRTGCSVCAGTALHFTASEQGGGSPAGGPRPPAGAGGGELVEGRNVRREARGVGVGGFPTLDGACDSRHCAGGGEDHRREQPVRLAVEVPRVAGFITAGEVD